MSVTPAFQNHWFFGALRCLDCAGSLCFSILKTSEAPIGVSD